MENNFIVDKKIQKVGNKNLTEYYLTDRGLKLNRILYEMAVFGLDELECGDEGDVEIVNMFKDYYRDVFDVGE